MIYWLGLLCATVLAVRFASWLYYWSNRKVFHWHNENSWAVVTGSTSGIGYNIALHLACKGYNLMLISRSEEKLEQTKENIFDLLRTNGMNSIQIRTLAVDFTSPDIYGRIETFLNVKENDIFILVNNVGIAPKFLESFTDGAKAHFNQSLINVNVTGTTRMTELVLPEMILKRRGLLINVSSMSSLLPAAFLTTYAASKAYITHFSKCLAQECHPHNILVCVFNPFFVSTNMTHNLKENLFIPSADLFVRNALGGIQYFEDNEFIGYWLHSVVKYIARLYTLLFTEQYLNVQARKGLHKIIDIYKRKKRVIRVKLLPFYELKLDLSHF